jgi:hypothetical protein
VPERDAAQIVKRINEAIAAGSFRITRHAHEEMVEEEIMIVDLVEAIATGMLLEDYPEHRRGPCCLLSGRTRSGRPLHVVCTTDSSVVVVITVYEPKSPKWETPSRRGGRQ